MIRFQNVPPEKVDAKFMGANTRTKILDTGVSIETTRALMQYRKCPIIKLDADTYKVRKTGEVKSFKHTEKRTDNVNSIACSMKKLRDTINYNVTDLKKITWLTLTYAENMQDANRLYDDFRKFNMRLQYYCTKNSLPNYEYIAVVEPQQRGAWHMHVILLWDTAAPFIPNDVMESIWKHGFTKTTAITGNVDSLGYYLSAYLTDLPLEEALQTNADLSKGVLMKHDKKIAKAARLHLYPSGINLYRCSKGIKCPEPYFLPKIEADKLLAQREADLKRETYTYIYDDKKINAFGMLSQHCYYDTRPTAQAIYRLKKAFNTSKYYRTLYKEMLSIMSTNKF